MMRREKAASAEDASQKIKERHRFIRPGSVPGFSAEDEFLRRPLLLLVIHRGRVSGWRRCRLQAMSELISNSN